MNSFFQYSRVIIISKINLDGNSLQNKVQMFFDKKQVNFKIFC